jgi:hypothetical protein
MLRASRSAFTLLGLLLPASLLAQSQYEQQVLDILGTVSSPALDQGYSPARDAIISALPASDTEDQYINLRAGMDYVVVAVCDVDCSDIDLHLYSPSGAQVASDTETDDVPVLQLDGVQGGRYRLEVGMYSCSQEPCFYAVGVYARSGSQGGVAYVDQVLAILDAVSEVAEGEGYVATGEDWVSSLRARGSEDQFVTLGTGADYAIIAVCDEDCSDIDLKIYGPSGRLVDEDTQTDASPLLRIDDAQKGEHRIEVSMYQCSTEPCYYAMALYKRVRKEWVPVPMPKPER